jgi:hypothetical protein
MIAYREGSVMVSRFWLGVLGVGMVVGALLSTQGGAVAREDVLTPVLALGVALPLGWGGASVAEAVRARTRSRRED